MTISERLKQIRIIKGFTQSEIADRLDISPSAYGQIEKNADKSNLITLKKIADVLNVSVSYILDIKNNL